MQGGASGLPTICGSYEELPPNLLDELKRDRRWCHGNLMNFRLFGERDAPCSPCGVPDGRYVLSVCAAVVYVPALSTALQVVHALTEPQYFLQPRQLFPVWPQWRPELAIALFASTMVLLFLPKLLSIILIWCKGSKEYGGFCRVTLSLLLEVLFSVLLAPVRMLFHTVFVVSAFWDGKWCGIHRSVTMTLRRGVRPLCATALSCCWARCGPLVWLAGSAFPVLAGANRLLADPVAVCVGDLQPFHGWPAYQTLEAVPDPGRVFSAAGAGGYRYLSGAEPQTHAG